MVNPDTVKSALTNHLRLGKVNRTQLSISTMMFRLTCSFIALTFSVMLTLNVAAISPVTAAPQASSPETASQASLDQKLNQLIQTATRTQQSGNLKLAASQWQAVWEQFPDSPFTGAARFQAGSCYQQLKDYPLAIEHLKAAILKLDRTDNLLPKAKFFLGYSQFQLGQRQLKTAADAVQKKQASDLLVTATHTLGRLLKDHPNFPDAYQAYYFLGGTYEQLDRQQDAIDAYQKMIAAPNPNGVFQYESKFAIADLNFELGRYEQAKQYFDQLLTDPKTKDRSDRNLVVFSAAENAIALGVAIKQNGVAADSLLHFAAAETLLKLLVKPVGSDGPSIALARDAERQLAFCYLQQDKFQAAAQTYASVYKKLNDKDPFAIKVQTATDAGLAYLKAGDVENCEAFLKLATATIRPEPAEAARLLSSYYLEQQRFEDAYGLATKFIPVALPPHLLPLKMNQAKAAMEIDARLDESIALFQSIAVDFPDHELASAALYNVAVGQVKAGQYTAAITTTDELLARYPDHHRLADILDVEGNALALSGQHSNAEKVFERLINDPSLAENPNRSDWILANARSKFAQENFDGVITKLKATIESIEDPAKVASALYLLGASHYQLQQYDLATTQLTASIAAMMKINDQSSLRNDAQAYLGLSLLKQDRYELAKQTIDRLAIDAPKSPLLNQAYVQLGYNRYQADQQTDAIALFQKVIDAEQAKPAEKANAIHGAAWAHLKSQNLDLAQSLFKQVIKTYPESELIPSARTGLANAQQLAGVTPVPETPPVDPDSRLAAEAKFDLGKLAYDQRRYDDAIKAFMTCIADQDNLSPAIREKSAYKLAWAYYKQNKFAQAHTAFTRQTQLFPDGPLLADGKFMVAESLFRNQQFGPAFVAYKAAKPILDRSTTSDANLKWLTILHGAQSAIKQGDYQATIDWTQGIAISAADESLKQDVFLEIGKAYRGLQDATNAAKYWYLAMPSLSKTGAEATCLVGHQLLENKRYDDAEREFKKVFFGFGGKEAKPSIRPWQAYARYEAARSNFLRSQATADSQIKQAYRKIAIKHFQALVDDYPDDRLAPKAQRELESLRL